VLAGKPQTVAARAFLRLDPDGMVGPMPDQTPFTAATPAGPIAGSHSGSGPALLLLHGGPAMSDYMDLLAPELDGWQAIRYQQRGLAPSAQDGPFTVEQHVTDAVAVLDELGAERAVVLGHSWGGHLALHLAVTHPGRVAGLIAVDPLGAVGDGGVGEMGAAMAARLSPASLVQLEAVNARLATPAAKDADALASLRLLWPGYFADPAAAPPLPGSMRISLACYGGTFGSVAGHLGSGFGGRLKEITAPAVFVLGELSPMPPRQGEETAALLPGAEVRVVPGAGHLPWHEKPGCVADAAGWIRGRLAA
jgi:pimeloyl-ACP methyl ester carboxylesterase